MIVMVWLIPAKLVPTPDALTCCRFPPPDTNVPWTLFTIREFTLDTAPTVNLIPTPVSPTVAPNTSPVLYPDPAVVTLRVPTFPLLIWTLASAPLPSPVIVVKPIPVYVWLPEAGTNPLPLPVWCVIDASGPSWATTFPRAVPCLTWEPIAKSLVGEVVFVLNEILISWELLVIGFGLNIGFSFSPTPVNGL